MYLYTQVHVPVYTGKGGKAPARLPRDRCCCRGYGGRLRGQVCTARAGARGGSGGLKRETIYTMALELEGVLCQTSGSGKFTAFRRASQAGAAGNESLGQTVYRYVLVDRSTYLAQIIIYRGIIVWTCIYFT